MDTVELGSVQGSDDFLVGVAGGVVLDVAGEVVSVEDLLVEVLDLEVGGAVARVKGLTGFLNLNMVEGYVLMNEAFYEGINVAGGLVGIDLDVAPRVNEFQIKQRQHLVVLQAGFLEKILDVTHLD